MPFCGPRISRRWLVHRSARATGRPLFFVLALTLGSAELFSFSRAWPQAAPEAATSVVVLQGAVASRSSEAVKVLAIVPLGQGLEATLAVCRDVVGTMPALPKSAGGPAIYSCKIESARKIERVATQSHEPGVRAVLHTLTSAGQEREMGAFELLNVSGLLPEGRLMALCYLITNLDSERAAAGGTEGMAKSLHYTCQSDDR